MKPRSKIVWKLTAVAAAILIAATALSAHVPMQIPLVLGIVAIWYMFGLMLERPIGELIEGTKQIAAHRLDFRFDRSRNDEIGLLEESFNAMTATIQASQDELRDAKEYLEGMVENSADIIITVNSEGLIETFNRGGEEALGYRREEVISKRIESLFAEPRERYNATVRLRKTGHIKNYETRLLAKDGRIRNVLLTLSYLRNSQGAPIGTIGISKDITQEKKFQDELRDAKQYLEGMVENSTDIIITVNSEGLIQTFNRGGEDALGYRREEVIGRQIESLYVDPSERHAAAARLEDTGNVKNYETRLLTKDGPALDILLTLSRLCDGDGNPIGTIGISKDITQEKELQDDLRNAKEYLEGMVENSADIIITVNPKGLIQTFNRGGEDALGYRREEVIGRRIEMLFMDPREREVAIARLEDTDNVRNYETRFRAKDGQVRNVLLTLSRLRNREGNPMGTMGISKDITQEKKLQRELLQSQKLAAIGQAVTGIHHAVKNMLDVLNGGAYLVRNGMAKDDPNRVEEGCAMVEQSIEQISSLSHHMLNFAKEWKPELERVSLNDLVKSIRGLNRQTAADHGVTLSHQPAEGLPAVLCDPALIRMAVTDLLVNSFDACAWKHYSPGESPEIVLENYLGEGQGVLVIEVRDNGCGMTENIRRHIFTPFFSTKKTRGTGLGLAVTDRIIKVHGGRISVESEPNRGTKFLIHLPVDGPRDNKEADDAQTSPNN